MIFKKWLLVICLPSCLWACSEKDATQKTVSVKLSTSMIDWYKAHVSPLNVMGCDYYPSCSQYTKEAIEKYGFFKGWLLGCDRLMRCNSDDWVYAKIEVDGEVKKFNPVP